MDNGARWRNRWKAFFVGRNGARRIFSRALSAYHGGGKAVVPERADIFGSVELTIKFDSKY